MLTIPTAEFTGVLADVIPFAWTDDALPSLNAVQLHWDGEELHAYATDRLTAGWARWSPDDDPPDGEPAEDDLFTQWGSGDNRWVATLPLADAKELVSVFRLPAKEGRAPLQVETLPGQLFVRRHRDTGHSAITTVYKTLDVGFPDIVELIRGIQIKTGAVDHIAFGAKLLAKFAKVRPHGPLELWLTGDRDAVRVAIGTRFTGVIAPVRLAEQVPVEEPTALPPDNEPDQPDQLPEPDEPGEDQERGEITADNARAGDPDPTADFASDISSCFGVVCAVWPNGGHGDG